jgi:hypothetical protein
MIHWTLGINIPDDLVTIHEEALHNVWEAENPPYYGDKMRKSAHDGGDKKSPKGSVKLKTRKKGFIPAKPTP